MGYEIERKFLVKGEDWKRGAASSRCCQGYICRSKDCVVRVRTSGDRGFLTVKGAVSGLTRPEFEYEIPVSDAISLLNDFCEKPLIQKTRHLVTAKGFLWEVDEFFAENQGLVIAEIELKSEDQLFERPDWIGREVTGDPRYYNASLVKKPFSHWVKQS